MCRDAAAMISSIRCVVKAKGDLVNNVEIREYRGPESDGGSALVSGVWGSRTTV